MLTLKRILAGIRRRGRRWFDWRIVRWYSLSSYQQVWYLRRLFKWQAVDLVLDVGGNSGQFAKFIRKRVGYRGLMLTFEPIPALAAQLALRAAGDPNWVIIGKALGDSSGKASFNIMNTSQMSSLLEPKHDSRSSVMQFNQVVSRVEVDVTTLDEFLLADDLTRSCKNLYLKLDVQGYEMKVLAGLSASLPRVCALQAEMNVTPLYEGQPGYLELLQHLDSAGYSLSLVPAHDYEQFPEMVDFDCHFVRRDRLIAPLAEALHPGVPATSPNQAVQS